MAGALNGSLEECRSLLEQPPDNESESGAMVYALNFTGIKWLPYGALGCLSSMTRSVPEPKLAEFQISSSFYRDSRAAY